jgi:ABC-type nitrate/sulfonate/bicarbonate transport system substrate-binding protein
VWATVVGAPVKIGFSKNPWARAVDIQTANHEKLTVLAAMRCKSHSEVELHTVLKAYRRAGEWFKLPRNIEKTILTASDRKTNYEDFVVELRALLRSATTETETDTEADTESEKKEPRVAALVDDGWPDDYRKQFWDIWPNKVAKQKALMKLERIRKRGVSWGTLMDGVRRYIRTKPPDRSWMNPETFLNGERWNDQPAEISGGKSESLASVAKRQADAGISFGPRPTGLRLVEGGDDVRLLSQAGRERPGDLRGGGDRDPLGISGFGD